MIKKSLKSLLLKNMLDHQRRRHAGELDTLKTKSKQYTRIAKVFMCLNIILIALLLVAVIAI